MTDHFNFDQRSVDELVEARHRNPGKTDQQTALATPSTPVNARKGGRQFTALPVKDVLKIRMKDLV